MLRYLLLVFLLLSLTACGPRSFNFGGPQDQLPKLTVSGEGQVEVLPDQLQLRLGVVTQEAEVDAALASNNQKMAAVMAQLEELGLTGEELSTGQFQIRPEWSQPPRPTPANWQREIIAYRVSNELLISTDKVNLAGRLLALAQQSGANQIGGLQFSLADRSEARLQAIELATAKAIRKAEAMAAAAGVKLGPIQLLSLDSPGHQPRPMMLGEARIASAEAAPVPVAPGRVEVNATVSISYRLLAPEDPEK